MIKKIKAPSKKRLRGMADVLFRDVCLKLNNRCLLCDAPGNQVHHFKPKGFYGHMRYLIENGIPLCFSCHFKLTFADSSLQAKIAEIKGSLWFKKIQDEARKRPASYQTTKWYLDNIEYLKRVLKKL